MSWSTDLSPTTIFSLAALPVHDSSVHGDRWGRGRVYPGYRDDWVAGRGYTGYPARPVPGPLFNIYLRLSPTHGQMRAILRYSMRFLR